MLSHRRLHFLVMVSLVSVLTTLPALAEDSKQAKDKDTKAKSTEKKESEKKQKFHLLTLDGIYKDRPEPFAIDPTTLLLGGSAAKQKSFFKLCDYLEQLAEDKDTKHIALDLSAGTISMNSAQLDEITRRLGELKKSDKQLYAWLESASNVHLSLAAVCDKVVMADFGVIDMPSMAMQTMFYRDAMDIFGIKASVVRAGDFKGAVEPFTNSTMSSHLRSHYQRMLKTMNDSMVDRIAKGRGLTAERIRELQGKRILLPRDAHEAGLVDRLAPYGSMKETLASLAGGNVEWTTPKKKAKRQMSFFELMGKMMAGPSTSRVREPSIAILHLSGVILDGTSTQPGAIVSGPMAKEIKKLADDEKIKGVVVRVNSPGGSATASEVIRKALEQLAAKKPTIVSMGDVAASGGYWVSSIGVPIYAERGTLTGSIGVFSMKLSFGSLMRRLGVHLESIALDDSAVFLSMDRTWSDEDKERLGKLTDDVYGRFLGLVGDSRSLPVDEVKGIAGGRVWSGAQAKSLGLIDEIGGVDQCIRVTAKKAELKDYKIVHRPVAKQGLDLLDLLGTGDEEEILSSTVSSHALRLLKAKGMSLQTTSAIVQDALSQDNLTPRTWVLLPVELGIR